MHLFSKADVVSNVFLQFLTDAGQYVIRFGDVLPKASIQHATPVSVEAVDRKPFLLTKSEKTGAAEMQELRQAADQVTNFFPLKWTNYYDSLM